MRQETTAPITRRIDALTGAKAPDKFFGALADVDDQLVLARSDADDAAETIGLLLAERDELASEVVELRRQVSEWNRCYGREYAELERLREQACRVDELDEELAHVREINLRLVGEAASLRRQLARVTGERDTYRAAVSGVR